MEKYEVIKAIGEGAFGRAYLAKGKSDSKYCVIKEINFTKMPIQEKEASRKEVILLAKMKHPNIVAFFSSFQAPDSELVLTKPLFILKQLIQHRRPWLLASSVLGWFVQVCLGLKHIHDRKILHRDVKTQNIFLSKNGTVAKLGDFGIARVLNSSMELARTCVGTPYYLSPEICQNKPYNNKTDIWSLGCVLYELCTLKHPFEGNNLHQLILKICQARFAPISPRFSHDLQSLMSQLFKVSPRDRPSINSVLKRPFLENLIGKYLAPEVIQEEFNRELIHRAGASAAQPPGKTVPDPKRQKMRYREKCPPRPRLPIPMKRKHVLPRSEWRPPSGAPKPLPIKMVERPKLAGVCGLYDHYYLQLDLLRKRYEGLNYHSVPQKDVRVENYKQEENHHPSLGQWSAEYLKRKVEAQQYKLKVEKQLGLRPSSAEPNHHGRQELRRNEDSRFQEQQLKRNKIKEQEYWKQLEEIRQQYHTDMKEIRRKVGRELEEDSKIHHKTYLVKTSKLPDHQERPEEELPVQKGITFEINLDKCITEENFLQEGKVCGDILNETLNFEDDRKFKEDKSMKQHEDYTDKAFEQLCFPEAEVVPQKAAAAAAAENRRQWGTGAPQTLLRMMAAADVTSTCSSEPADGQVLVLEGVPENRKHWRHEAPGTLLDALSAAHLMTSSFSANEGKLGGTLQQWFPKEDEDKVEVASDVEPDEEQPESRSDDDDTIFASPPFPEHLNLPSCVGLLTNRLAAHVHLEATRKEDLAMNFEESEDELRDVVESLEKLTTSNEKEKNEEASCFSKDVKESGDRERMSTQKYEQCNECLESSFTPSNDLSDPI
ncbi:PREDICTED: serine/threonine-protein kinase Nek5 [Elephantulus edwardii]|uniref:serine/threonine-protein kinase Nek5 n=1 Tax=Elephantulus edwardii TaxID=28737 RepID=UPI0003F0B0D7|nr:PREDICTED: serine/threonine-protein kinase Nek5 [Elephantulus edwardii]